MCFKDPVVKEEYMRALGAVGELSTLRPPLVGVRDALLAYFALVDYFTDPENGEIEDMLVGLRSGDLLCSALGRQCVSFGGEVKYEAPLDIAATLFFGMVKNHPFSDGNKRTALLLLLYQLSLLGYRPVAPDEALEGLVVAVAAGELGRGDAAVAAIAARLAEMTVADAKALPDVGSLTVLIRRFEAPLRRLKDE